MALPSLYTVTADNTIVTADSTEYFADGGRRIAWTFDPASLRNPNTVLYEIPIANAPCLFTVDLPSGTYNFRLTFAAADEAGWILDVRDITDTLLLSGVPLITGLDLLKQYAYIGIAARFFVFSAGDAAAVPGFTDLGTNSRLYVELAA